MSFAVSVPNVTSAGRSVLWTYSGGPSLPPGSRRRIWNAIPLLRSPAPSAPGSGWEGRFAESSRCRRHRSVDSIWLQAITAPVLLRFDERQHGFVIERLLRVAGADRLVELHDEAIGRLRARPDPHAPHRLLIRAGRMQPRLAAGHQHELVDGAVGVGRLELRVIETHGRVE